MAQRTQPGVDRFQRKRKWFKSTVTSHRGTIDAVRAHLPAFERRSFSLTQADESRSRLNEHQDLIVRTSIGTDVDFVPVGVVSKEYALIQHLDVVDVVVKALEVSDIAPRGVTAQLEITEYGERMSLGFLLPMRYAFDPGDGHLMALRLECLNSVEGSTGFRALMGWFRFVCSNGLTIGVTQLEVRRRHVGNLTLDAVATVLQAGVWQSVRRRRETSGCGSAPGSIRPSWSSGSMTISGTPGGSRRPHARFTSPRPARTWRLRGRTRAIRPRPFR